MELINEELKKVFKNYPLYSQDGKGQKAIVIVKYFFPLSDATWIITEAEECPDGDWRLFGYICITDWEWGYVMLSELQKVYSRLRETCIWKKIQQLKSVSNKIS